MSLASDCRPKDVPATPLPTETFYATNAGNAREFEDVEGHASTAYWRLSADRTYESKKRKLKPLLT